ncbi:MAG: flagellar hook-basal body complex protein FliE [Treponema sp.]|nr:flagellar hook-basal body complex protein FliE [Treponema sp.]
MDTMIPMVLTHQKHMGLSAHFHADSGKRNPALENQLGAQGITTGGTFEQALLQSLDKVSGTQKFASNLEREAIINPDSVDVHDITIAQAKANMSLGIARNVLSRLVQGWRDLINTR